MVCNKCTECVPVCRTKMVKECVPVCKKVCTYKCVTETCTVPVTKVKCVPVCKTVTCNVCKTVCVPVQCKKTVMECVPCTEVCKGTKKVAKWVEKEVPCAPACTAACNPLSLTVLTMPPAPGKRPRLASGKPISKPGLFTAIR